MNHILKFNESNIDRNFIPTLLNLLSLMKNNKIISIDDVSVDKGLGESCLVKIKGIASIWIRENSIIGYYPGEIHTFFMVLSTEDGKGEYKVENKLTYNKVVKSIKNAIKRIEIGEKGAPGSFQLPELNLKSNPTPVLPNISDKTKKILKKFLKDF